MGVREQTLQKMAELQIDPKKSLGQNFLVSDHVVAKILQAVQYLKPGSLIEVGPGLGSLTDGLRTMDCPLQLLELDSAFVKYWQNQGLNVIEVDALRWDWSTATALHPRVLVSNLPYQISSSLVIDRTVDASLDAMILMFQKEVAQRLKAQPRNSNYGMLSVFTQTFWRLQMLLEASSGDFMPAPKVASRVLVFTPRETVVHDRPAFLKFCKACFLHPRKLMLSNLVEGFQPSRPVCVAAWEKLGWSLKVRPQELQVEQFVALFQALGYK